MVKIIIRGKPKNITLPEARLAFVFFSDYLLGRLSKNISIDATFVQNMFIDDKDYGAMTWLDSKTRYPRKFSVEIDADLSEKKSILTICHEMVHVEQYSRGRLKDLHKRFSKKWMGEVFSEDYEYLKQPWEAEALNLEPILYKLWIEYRRKLDESNNGSKKIIYRRRVE